jgi:hypothetical protein
MTGDQVGPPRILEWLNDVNFHGPFSAIRAVLNGACLGRALKA